MTRGSELKETEPEFQPRLVSKAYCIRHGLVPGKPGWGFKGMKERTEDKDAGKAEIGWAVLVLWSSTNYSSNSELLTLRHVQSRRKG